jgi:hypothetical protein
MFVPVENTELQSGTYTFSPDFEPFTYIPGFAYIGMVAPLVGGTVTVDRTDNNIYTIEFALQCLVGGTEVGDITGTIHGSLLKEKGTDTGGGE